MSCEFSVSLVNWEAFEQAVRKGVDHEEVTGDFPPEPGADGGSWIVAGEIWARFEDMREEWRSAGGKAFAELFGDLFWSFGTGGRRINDLGLPKDNAYSMESAWSPATVDHFAELWRKISLEECRPFFRSSPDDYPAFTTFDEFKSYIESWGAIIERGAEEGLGLIVFIWA